MGTTIQNRFIARLIIAAMSIDGIFSKEQQSAVAKTLEKLGMLELVAELGVALEEEHGDINVFEVCRELIASLGSNAQEFGPIVFRLIAEVIACDRFVSLEEASFLSALARRFKLNTAAASKILRQVMAERRGKLEVAGAGVDAGLHPQLKELLSFDGAENLVGEVSENSLEEMLYEARQAMTEGYEQSADEIERAFAVLGLRNGAMIEDVEAVWRESINSLNLPKMVELGETFVTAALNKINEVHGAYKTIFGLKKHLDHLKRASTEATKLEQQLEDAGAKSNRDKLASDLETKLTGVGTVKPEDV